MKAVEEVNCLYTPYEIKLKSELKRLDASKVL